MRGIDCPLCGAEGSKCLSTRVSSRGSILRRRQCYACGVKFSTEEKTIVLRAVTLRPAQDKNPTPADPSAALFNIFFPKRS